MYALSRKMIRQDIHSLWQELMQNYILTKPFSLKDSGLSRRLITYWEEKGLIAGDEKEEEKWRRFSLIDLVWLRLIAKLRDLEIGVPMIKEIRADLFSNVELDQEVVIARVHEVSCIDENSKEQPTSDKIKSALKDTSVSKLFSYVASLYLNKTQYSILFFKDENENTVFSSLLSEKDFEDQLKIPGFRNAFFLTHITVNLNDLIKDVFAVADLQFLNILVLLSEDEQKVLEAVRSGKFKSVRIRFGDDKKPLLMETTEEKKIKIESRLLEIIHSSSYEDIEIKTQNGKIVSFFKTKKTKFR